MKIKSLSQCQVPSKKGIQKLKTIDKKKDIVFYLLNRYEWLNKMIDDDLKLNRKNIKYPKHFSRKKYKHYFCIYNSYYKKYDKRIESWKSLCSLCEKKYANYWGICDDCNNLIIETVKKI